MDARLAQLQIFVLNVLQIITYSRIRNANNYVHPVTLEILYHNSASNVLVVVIIVTTKLRV